MNTVNHTASNRGITAMLKREMIASAASAWMATEPNNDEADLALETALLATGVIRPGEFVDEIHSDDPETVRIVVNGAIVIEIDVKTGCHARGEME